MFCELNNNKSQEAGVLFVIGYYRGMVVFEQSRLHSIRYEYSNDDLFTHSTNVRLNFIHNNLISVHFIKYHASAIYINHVYKEHIMLAFSFIFKKR